jgi:hypothetical protein
VLELHGTSRFVTCASCGYRGPVAEVFAPGLVIVNPSPAPYDEAAADVVREPIGSAPAKAAPGPGGIRLARLDRAYGNGRASWKRAVRPAGAKIPAIPLLD